jgi:hypothetical protein
MSETGKRVVITVTSRLQLLVLRAGQLLQQCLAFLFLGWKYRFGIYLTNYIQHAFLGFCIALPFAPLQ